MSDKTGRDKRMLQMTDGKSPDKSTITRALAIALVAAKQADDDAANLTLGKTRKP